MSLDIIDGLDLYQGQQIAIDATLVSPLTREGMPRLRSHLVDGAALVDAQRNKERTYHDVVCARRCHLLIAGIETGGRWSIEFSHFIRHLAKARAAACPPLVRKSMAVIYLPKAGQQQRETTGEEKLGGLGPQ